MITGLSGSLLSHEAVERLLRPAPATARLEGDEPQLLRAWRTSHASIRQELGPASSARIVFDRVAEPLARALGYRVVPSSADGAMIRAVLHVRGVPAAALIVTAWGTPAAWSDAIRHGLAHGVRWCICADGAFLSVFDVDRAYSRRYARFELDATMGDPQAWRFLVGLLAAAGMVPGEGAERPLDSAVRASEGHRAAVRSSLRRGVLDALNDLIGAFGLAARRRPGAALFDESLTVVYRLLFLLFAEARGLVPGWHPVYRKSYTVEVLVEPLQRGTVSAGIWEGLQAVFRLAHRGCHVGALTMTPFNGPLFSPSRAPLADTVRLNDGLVARALVALTTRKARDGSERISYADLGVEQLGGVYEHLLDYELAPASRRGPALVPGARRKITGSFYTPRALTEFLVRRALAPLVQGAAPEEILRLRVLDPAMGSGAFLVAACRYLANAYEQALVREGMLAASDIDGTDRAAFRRTVAQRCLFGVDMNPMAVHLARLSLWLATLAVDKPLTFLDHHLRCGNSLVGASPEDVARYRVPGGRAKTRELPLFSSESVQDSLQLAVGTRLELALTADDTPEQVRGKERKLLSLDGPEGPLDRLKRAADLWCAAWYTRLKRARSPGPFRTLLEYVTTRGAGVLPAGVAEPLLDEVRAVAAVERFFHWTLEFPEAFYNEDGAPLPKGGFHVILGNPPWEMLRQDGGAGSRSALAGFVRGSGLYRLALGGHTNLYQLFVERAFGLLGPGGRGALVLPAGFAVDQSCTALRRWLFERTTVDTFTILENHDAAFPVHRSLKFLLLTFRNEGTTSELMVSTGGRSVQALDAVPDAGPAPRALTVRRALLERVSGGTLAVPEMRCASDLEITAAVSFRFAPAGDPEGWGLRFGRELNATEDRPYFTAGGPGLPVIEGKHLRPFVVDGHASRYRIPRAVATKLLGARAAFRRARLAYRDVASPGNRTTLIAAILPPDVVTTHTVLCLQSPLPADAQQFLCGMFNSYVANYLIRMRVSTHVTAALVSRLPIPRPSGDDRRFSRVADLARRLADGPDPRALAGLNATAAQLYGLTQPQFQHVLNTFPLVGADERAAALSAFDE